MSWLDDNQLAIRLAPYDNGFDVSPSLYLTQDKTVELVCELPYRYVPSRLIKALGVLATSWTSF